MSKQWSEDELKRLFAAFNLMVGSTQQGESDAARAAVGKMLKSQGCTMSDLLDLVNHAKQIIDSKQQPPAPPPDESPISVLEAFTVVKAMFKEYVTLEPHEYTVCALWVLHSHAFRSFACTPRLILRSAVRDCGKSTTLGVIQLFVRNPQRSDHMTVAAFFRYTNFGYSMLLDEIDNLGLLADARFRAGLNSGYHCDGSFHIKGKSFRTFACVVLSGIGSVPLPLARRSLIIPLKRDPDAPRTRKRFNKSDPTLKTRSTKSNRI